MPAKRAKTSRKTAKGPRKTAKPKTTKKISKSTTKTARKPAKSTRKAAPKTTKAGTRTAKTARKPTTKRTTRKAKTPAGADENFPNITLQPMLVVPDMNAEIAFLEALGFQTVMKMPGPGGMIMHAVLTKGNAMVHVDPIMRAADLEGMPGLTEGLLERARKVENGSLGLGVSLYVMVDDVNKVAATLNRLNAPIVKPVTDEFWGDRTLMCTDPAGYLWNFAQHIRDVAPDEMEQAMKQMAAQ